MGKKKRKKYNKRSDKVSQRSNTNMSTSTKCDRGSSKDPQQNKSISPISDPPSKIPGKFQGIHKILNTIWGKTVVAIGVISGLITIFLFFRPQSTPSISQDVYVHFPHEQNVDLNIPNAHYKQGQAFFEQNEFQKAIQYYKKALKEHESMSHVDIDTARIQYALGIAYKYQGDLERSIGSYTLALGTLESVKEAGTEANTLQLDHEIGYIYYLRSIAYLENNDLKLAFDDCKASDDALNELPLDPTETSLYTKASVYDLFGRISASSYYGAHSIYSTPKDKEEELGYDLGDAFKCFNRALMLKGVEYISEEEIDQELSKNTEDLIIYGFPNEQGEDVFQGKDTHSRYDSELCYWRLKDPDEETATILTNRAMIASMWHYHVLAMNDASAAIKIYKGIPEKKQYNITDAYFYFAVSMLEASITENGEIPYDVAQRYKVYMEKSLAHNKKWYGDNIRTAKSYEMLASACMELNELEAAIGYFNEAIRIYDMFKKEGYANEDRMFIEMLQEVIDSGEEFDMHFKTIKVENWRNTFIDENKLLLPNYIDE